MEQVEAAGNYSIARSVMDCNRHHSNEMRDEMGRECGMHGQNRRTYRVW
jgi:hypothetical protein